MSNARFYIHCDRIVRCRSPLFSGRIIRLVGGRRLSERGCVCRNRFVRFLHFRKFVGFAEVNANERDKDDRMPASAKKIAAVFVSLINPLKFKEAEKRESLTFSSRPFLNGVPEGGVFYHASCLSDAADRIHERTF